MTKNEIKVLIAGVGGGSFGLENMKALRLSNVPYYIIGVDMSDKSLGIFKCDKSYVVPSASDSKYTDSILDICEHERIQVVIPGSEPDLKAISENRERFEEKCIFLPINSRETITICLDKKQTFDYLAKKNIIIPKTIAIDSEKDLDGIDFFPVIIKPYIGGGGSNNTFIAQDKDELFLFCKHLLKYGIKPLVQQYVGSHNNEYTVGVLSDKDGNIISSIALKRNILSALSNRLKVRSINDKNEILTISSGISQGEIVFEPKLLEQCEQIAQSVNSKGPLNIQCRFVDNKVYLFEINPRLSGTTYIRALAGNNEPDLLIRKYVLGEDIQKHIQIKKGLILRGLEETFIGKNKLKNQLVNKDLGASL